MAYVGGGGLVRVRRSSQPIVGILLTSAANTLELVPDQRKPAKGNTRPLLLLVLLSRALLELSVTSVTNAGGVRNLPASVYGAVFLLMSLFAMI